jgi:hypothetical protein
MDRLVATVVIFQLLTSSCAFVLSYELLSVSFRYSRDIVSVLCTKYYSLVGEVLLIVANYCYRL